MVCGITIGSLCCGPAGRSDERMPLCTSHCTADVHHAARSWIRNHAWGAAPQRCRWRAGGWCTRWCARCPRSRAQRASRCWPRARPGLRGGHTCWGASPHVEWKIEENPIFQYNRPIKPQVHHKTLQPSLKVTTADACRHAAGRRTHMLGMWHAVFLRRQYRLRHPAQGLA